MISRTHKRRGHTPSSCFVLTAGEKRTAGVTLSEAKGLRDAERSEA